MQTLRGHTLLLHRHTRKRSQPCVSVSHIFKTTGSSLSKLTAFGIFFHRLLNLALICDTDVLSLKSAAVCGKAAIRIHGLLQRVVFPAEDVVSVLSVAGGVACAQNEGLGAVCGPVCLVVELGGVPYNLPRC